MSRVSPRLPPAPSTGAAALACAVLAGLAATGPALAACGAPPDIATPPVELPATRPGGPGPTASPSGGVPATPTPATSGVPLPPSPTGFPDTYPVSCEGKPTGTQVIRLLRREGGLLPDGVRTTVETGPLCSGSWQYTVVVVPGREPLAVVTRGRPGDLRLVTAGTNVCSIPVRTQAPIGIRTAAAC